VKCVSKIQVII